MNKFSKRHYEIIARQIKEAIEDNISIISFMSRLADVFEQDNERFNRAKFIIACF